MTIFFVHIPKTAGTSFRRSMERHHSSERTLYDYGYKSPETSELVRAHGYHSPLNEFFEPLRRHDFIAGHVPATKYAPLVGIGNTFTFVREPLQRSYSEFLVMRDRRGFRGSLEEFLALPFNRNRQSHFLSRVPLSGLGFIGLTEAYDDSLALLRYTFPELSIESLKLNRNQERPESGYSFSASERQILEDANREDTLLYEACKNLFDQRRRTMQEQGQVLRFGIEEHGEREIRGWIGGATAHDVEAVLDGQVVATSPATAFRPSLAGWGMERKGYLGFRIRSDTIDLRRCRLRMAQTGEFLPDTGAAGTSTP